MVVCCKASVKACGVFALGAAQWTWWYAWLLMGSGKILGKTSPMRWLLMIRPDCQPKQAAGPVKRNEGMNRTR